MSFILIFGTLSFPKEEQRYRRGLTVYELAMNCHSRLYDLQRVATLPCEMPIASVIGKESVPKIIVNDSNFFLKLRAAFWCDLKPQQILSFSGKIAFVYVVWLIY